MRRRRETSRILATAALAIGLLAATFQVGTVAAAATPGDLLHDDFTVDSSIDAKTWVVGEDSVGNAAAGALQCPYNIAIWTPPTLSQAGLVFDSGPDASHSQIIHSLSSFTAPFQVDAITNLTKGHGQSIWMGLSNGDFTQYFTIGINGDATTGSRGIQATSPASPSTSICHGYRDPYPGPEVNRTYELIFQADKDGNVTFQLRDPFANKNLGTALTGQAGAGPFYLSIGTHKGGSEPPGTGSTWTRVDVSTPQGPFISIDSFAATPSTITQGTRVTISANVSGGIGPTTFGWDGLPQDCPSPAGSSVSCSPAEQGTYSVTITATDSTGVPRTATTQLVVLPKALTISPLKIEPDAHAMAIGVPARITPAVSGGQHPYAGTWSNLPPGCHAPDSINVTCSPTTAGIFQAALSVTDHAGASRSAAVNVTVVNANCKAAPFSAPYTVDTSANSPPNHVDFTSCARRAPAGAEIRVFVIALSASDEAIPNTPVAWCASGASLSAFDSTTNATGIASALVTSSVPGDALITARMPGIGQDGRAGPTEVSFDSDSSSSTGPSVCDPPPVQPWGTVGPSSLNHSASPSELTGDNTSGTRSPLRCSANSQCSESIDFANSSQVLDNRFWTSRLQDILIQNFGDKPPGAVSFSIGGTSTRNAQGLNLTATRLGEIAAQQILSIAPPLTIDANVTIPASSNGAPVFLALANGIHDYPPHSDQVTLLLKTNRTQGVPAASLVAVGATRWTEYYAGNSLKDANGRSLPAVEPGVIYHLHIAIDADARLNLSVSVPDGTQYVHQFTSTDHRLVWTTDPKEDLWNPPFEVVIGSIHDPLSQDGQATTSIWKDVEIRGTPGPLHFERVDAPPPPRPPIPVGPVLCNGIPESSNHICGGEQFLARRAAPEFDLPYGLPASEVFRRAIRQDATFSPSQAAPEETITSVPSNCQSEQPYGFWVGGMHVCESEPEFKAYLASHGTVSPCIFGHPGSEPNSWICPDQASVGAAQGSELNCGPGITGPSCEALAYFASGILAGSLISSSSGVVRLVGVVYCGLSVSSEFIDATQSSSRTLEGVLHFTIHGLSAAAVLRDCLE